jgi:hypothetical protein
MSVYSGSPEACPSSKWRYTFISDERSQIDKRKYFPLISLPIALIVAHNTPIAGMYTPYELCR